jgi:type I protein arginine methyltransferase
MYDISDYGVMIGDNLRIEVYENALRQTIRPGSVVIDLGSGTGIFALLACQFGAARVYAVEPSDAIHVAREIAAANGFTDRIVFIQERSTRVSLPERAAVIVSDMRGVLPLFEHHLTSIADARRRLLAPDGVLIPRCDTLWAAIVDAPESYWKRAAHPRDIGNGLDLHAAHKYEVNGWCKVRLAAEQLLVEPRKWATLDYTTLDDPDVHGEVAWVAERAGAAHGLCLWFDTTLAEGIGFSNAPGAPKLLYGSAFFPWKEPVTLGIGDVVSVALHADLVAGDYVWRWNTRVLAHGDPAWIKADFRQSSFFGVPLSPAQLRKQASSHIPVLGEEGQIDRQILTLMDGTMALEEIAQRICDCFPSRFSSSHEALTRVGELSQKYSR